MTVDVDETEGGLIAVRIQKDTNHGQFNDCMYFTPAEYNALTKQQIRDMATARKNDWVDAVQYAINHPYTPTKADKIEAAGNVWDNFVRHMEIVCADSGIRKSEVRAFKDKLQAELDVLTEAIAALGS
jgi:hypothetical protein